jgi:hypothetical protein
MKKLVVLLAFLLLATPAIAKNVNLQWDASPSPEAVGYKVCYSTQANILVAGQDIPTEGLLPICESLGNVLTTEYTNLQDDQAYYFGVVAYDSFDRPSVLSNIVQSPGFAVPQPPSNLGGTTTINNIDVPVQ